MKRPSLVRPEQRYHSISPCLAWKRSAEEQADALGLSYSTVCRWLRQFREEGMPGLFPATEYPREPQTPEHVIVALLFYKTCAPRASDRELARVLSATTDHRIHNETVKALLERYPPWRYPDFRELSAGCRDMLIINRRKLTKRHTVNAVIGRTHRLRIRCQWV
jgi:Homeodomain-like domain